MLLSLSPWLNMSGKKSFSYIGMQFRDLKVHDLCIEEPPDIAGPSACVRERDPRNPDLPPAPTIHCIKQ